MFRNALAVAVRPTTTTARTTLRARRNFDSTTRAVSSTPTAFAKVGSSKTRSGVKKSMAERPSDVPDDIDAPGEAKPLPTEQTFEPIVNDMRTSEGPHVVDSSASLDSTTSTTGKTQESTSSTPPTTATSEVPSSSSSSTTSTPPNQIPEEPYQIPDRPDLTKLPSLDFGLEEPVKEAPKIESPSGSQDGPSGSRTGARAKPSLSSIEQRRRNFTRFMLLGGLAGSGVGAYYLATKDDETKFGEAEAIGAWEKFKNNFTGLLDVSCMSRAFFAGLVGLRG
jgi:import inner membrane translocase subunit TIM50